MNEEQVKRFKFYVLKFKEHMEAEGYRERSVDTYVQSLESFIEYLSGTDVEELTQISKETIRAYQMNLYQSKTRKGEPLRLSTQMGKLVIVRSFFKFLVRNGYMMYDPACTIELPKKDETLPRTIMTKSEVMKLLNQPDCDSAAGLRDKAILELLYSTGIRNSELRGLEIYDVDIANEEVVIRDGKGGKSRVLPLGEIAAKYLDRYIKNGRPWFINKRQEYVKACANDADFDGENNLLFYGVVGRKICRSVLSYIVKQYVKKAKLTKDVTPHAIRHTFATHMLKGRANIRHIQAMLGHAKLDTTQVYTRVEVSDLKKEHRRCHPREQKQ